MASLDDIKRQSEGHCDAAMGVCARDIDRQRWKLFFDEFSRDHKEAQVSVEIRGEASGGAHWLSEDSPLLGLVYLEKEREAGSVEVAIGGPGSGPVTHIVRDVQRVWQQQDQHGREFLQIISADGTSVIVTVINAPQRAGA